MLLLYNLSVMIIVVHTILSFPFFADVSRKYGNVMANKEPFSSSYGIANKRKGQNTSYNNAALPPSKKFKKIYNLPSNSQMRDRLVTIQENVALLYLYVQCWGHNLRATKLSNTYPKFHLDLLKVFELFFCTLWRAYSNNC